MKKRNFTLTLPNCASKHPASKFVTHLILRSRNGNGDADDLWDFGTVRHGGRTIGRSSIKVSGPPLTWENDDLPRRRGSDDSDESILARRGHTSFSTSSSVTAKADLPPLPPSTPSSPSKQRFEQDTVRHAPAQSVHSNRGQPVATDYALPQGNNRSVQREPSDDYEDYGDQYLDTYSAKTGAVHQKMAEMHLEEDLPDTTMLDSVVLPAIASVSGSRLSAVGTRTHVTSQLFPRVSSQEARIALSALQRAFTEAERIIPGVTLELVNEIVDSVEHVEDIP